jgi:type III pantothenate kinase
MPPLPLIAVDIGNSSLKFGGFVSSSASSNQTHALLEPDWVKAIPTLADFGEEPFARLPDRVQWRVASVHRGSEKRLADWVQQVRPQDDYHCLSFQDLPLQIRLPQPDRVGLDRLAAAVAVNAIRDPQRAAVVIDAGSAMTIDLVDPQGCFLGGTILPGFRMSAQVLATAADLLPLALLETSAEPPPLPGQSTEAAIRAGLFWGAVGAAREIVARYSEQFSQPQIFVTGGDLQRLAPLVSTEAQFIPHLVLSGIARSVAR